MKTRGASWAITIGFSLTFLTLFILTTVGQLTAAPTEMPAAVAGGLYANRRSDGVIKTSTQGIHGPKTCTDFGDPYSPLNSVWAPGLYTYTYRIRIPDNYPSDIIRVELFDPDTINNAVASTIITHTDTAVANGLPITQTLSCLPNDQKDACLVDTGENLLVGVDQEQINPFWIVRVDENRGYGPDDGNGVCGQPTYYTPVYNTQTAYKLYYQADAGGGITQTVNLATYTGQVDDGVRDSGEHQTDLRWVSPGAAANYDQLAAAPTDCGSPNGGDYDPVACPGGTAAGSGSGFEVSISQDLANIAADPVTGERYLYLAVATINGASENVFELWAGPPDYVATIAGEVNQRNLQIYNNPGSHNSDGIIIFTDKYLPQNTMTDTLVDSPLMYVGPEYAGAEIYITHFDFDAGTQPPITFSLASLALTDWSMTFGLPGVDDPDGVAAGVRCLPGLCNNQWVTPAYTLTLPGDLSQCDWLNPNPADCTPFYGGRLMARYYGGSYGNTFGWQVTLSEPVAAPLQGCAAFPIAVQDEIRSVTAVTGPNPYPNLTDFIYPADPPAYDRFMSHSADIPLAAAEPGHVFKLVGEGFSVGNYGWLVWNAGRPFTADTLAASLTWPGDSLDYADHSDAGTAVGSFSHVVRGYVNPINPADVTLNTQNPVLASPATIHDGPVQTAVNTLIDSNRLLRLPLWNTGDGGNGRYTISSFAIFRIVGYGTTAGEGDWLLLEFVGQDTSCGQQLPTSVRLHEVAAGGSPGFMPAVTAAFLLLTGLGLVMWRRR